MMEQINRLMVMILLIMEGLGILMEQTGLPGTKLILFGQQYKLQHLLQRLAAKFQLSLN